LRTITCCIVSEAKNDLARAISEETGVCGNCRVDLIDIESLLSSIVGGQCDEDAIDVLEDLAENLVSRHHCPPVAGMLGPLLSSLKFSRAEFEAHVLARNCPAGVCERLIPAPCQNACPAGIDIPGYLALTARGRYGEALELIRQDNPFPWVCGLICPHPCEKACVRAKLDDPLNIRYLKAFVAEQAQQKSTFTFDKAPAKSKGIKVAVVGSGPAGLSCAFYLSISGYSVTIFEALSKPGGLLVYGIPEYRLPRFVVAKEIETIRSLGVEIRTGVSVGNDLTLDHLRKDGFRAFFFGIGAHRGYRLGIEGEKDFAPIYEAITFLREVNSGKRQKRGDRVVVIGGGNSAMDAARTCVRLGSGEVHLAYRRAREQMPANPQEVVEALEEGVNFHFLTIPIKVEGERQRVTGLECLRAELGEPDQSGRRRPVPVEGSNFHIEADAIITAIGQEPDLSPFLGKGNDSWLASLSGFGRILSSKPPVLHPTAALSPTQTLVPDVFAGGDAVTGPATVVKAIAAGKQAAIDIAHYLSGREGTARLFLNHKRGRQEFLRVQAADKIASRRVPNCHREIEVRRKNFEPVELGYSEDEARREAGRCLRCDVCIRCGVCNEVCREQMRIEALSFSEIAPDERMLSDYSRPAERCITCGACAIACPTGAMEIRDSNAHRELSLCGTVLNRLELLCCASCGAAFAPQRYIDLLAQNSDGEMGTTVARVLCPNCARTAGAHKFAWSMPPQEEQKDVNSKKEFG
jgi:NADPH-dependent glutamate synthase beta subunit-like oxidoreductase/Pyruvate/2-oxoacid:ferredoxin oxidoreductase delta subunit